MQLCPTRKSVCPSQVLGVKWLATLSMQCKSSRRRKNRRDWLVRSARIPRPMTFTCARWCTSAWKIARTIRPPSSCWSRPSLAIPSSHPPMRPWGANTGRRLLSSTQRENSGRRKRLPPWRMRCRWILNWRKGTSRGVTCSGLSPTITLMKKPCRTSGRALALNPSLAEAHHQLASVYNHIGLLDKASGEAQKAVALDPRNTGARFRVGINLLYQGKYEESLAAFRDSQRFFPSLSAFQSSFALYQLGRKDEAAVRVNEFLKKDPQDTGGLLTSMQALLAAAAGDQRCTEERIRSAIKIGEGYEHFHHTAYIIASTYALMNKTEPAMKYLRMAAEDGFPCYPLFDRDSNLNNIRKDPRVVQFMADQKKQWQYYMTVL